MPVIKTLSAAIRESISLGLWAFFLMIFAIFFVATMIVQSLTIGVGAGFLLGNLSEVPEQAFSQILSNLGQIVLVMGAALLVYLLIVFLISSVMYGLEFNGARLFLSGTRGIGQLLKDSWMATKPRFLTSFFLSLLVGIISLFFVALLFAPAVLSALSVASGNISGLSAAIFWLIIGVVVFIVVAFLTAPIMALLYPIVFFENLSVTKTIKRAVFLGARNYLRNIAFLLLFWLILLAGFVSLIILVFIAVLLGIFLFLVPLVGVFLGALLVIIVIACFVAFFFWIQAFSIIALTKYYELAKK